MLILAVLLLLLSPSSVCAESDLQIDYTFTAPDNLVQTGLRLRMDGAVVCDTVDIDGSFECPVVADAGSHSFTLAAIYDDESESAESPPYIFRIDGVGRRFFRVGGNVRRVAIIPDD